MIIKLLIYESYASHKLQRNVEMLTIEKSKVDQALADIQDMKTRLGLT
jgi:prefoldin subunit 5